MAEYAPSAIKNAFPIIDRAYGSARFSGILSGGNYGYHVSRNRLIRMGKTGDYSIQATADKRGNGDAGSGLDISMNQADMKLASRRLMDACERKDPRVQDKLREWFGTLDGRTVTGYSPYRGRRVSADKSHLWHIHLSGHREFADNAAVWRGFAEVMAGIPLGDSEPDNTKDAGWWHVNPDKVDSFLWGLKDGIDKNVQAKPGRNIDIDHWEVSGGRTWGVTDSDNWFDKAYLTKGKYNEPSTPPPAGGGTTPIDDEGFPMTDWKREHYFCDQPQQAKEPGLWQYLLITNQNNVSLTAGPAEVIGKLHVRLEIAEGSSAYFRVIEDDIDADGKAHRRETYHDHEEVAGTSGGTYRNFPIDLSIGGPKKDFRDNLVRIQWKSSDPEATILRADVVRRSTGR